jgi:bacterioferritin
MPTTKSTAKTSRRLLDLLNQAIAREIQVAIQYMWQHVQWSGVKGYAVNDALKKIAVVEMKHAETIAERLYYLGERPTTKPEPIFVGTTLKEMIKQDIKDEANAIKLYTTIIEVARKEGDEVTNLMFRHILQDEEEHHDFFTTVAEEI